MQLLEIVRLLTVLTFNNSTVADSFIDVTTKSTRQLSTCAEPVIPVNVKLSLSPSSLSSFASLSWQCHLRTIVKQGICFNHPVTAFSFNFDWHDPKTHSVFSGPSYCHSGFSIVAGPSNITRQSTSLSCW